MNKNEKKKKVNSYVYAVTIKWLEKRVGVGDGKLTNNYVLFTCVTVGSIP